MCDAKSGIQQADSKSTIDYFLDLVTAIQNLELSLEVKAFERHEFLTDFYQADNEHVLVEAVIEAANAALIMKEGRANMSSIDMMARVGILVTRGEYDSFGWLTGVIHTKKRSHCLRLTYPRRTPCQTIVK